MSVGRLGKRRVKVIYHESKIGKHTNCLYFLEMTLIRIIIIYKNGM